MKGEENENKKRDVSEMACTTMIGHASETTTNLDDIKFVN